MSEKTLQSPKLLKNRLELIALLPRRAALAEIGVRRAEFSVQIMELPNISHLYCVDAWRRQTWSAEQQDDQEHAKCKADCYHNLRGHLPGGRVTIIDGLSLDVAAHGKMVPLDGVYLDGAHDYANVLSDLRAWAPRLKPGGCLMGHDFTENDDAQRLGFGVVPAVNDFCREDGWEITYLTEEAFPSYRLDKTTNDIGAL